MARARRVARATKDERPLVELYRLKAVVWATFFGTVLGGGVIMAINYSRLGRRRACAAMLVCTALASLVVIWVAAVLPADHPLLGLLFTGAQLAVVYVIARGLQGHAIESNPGGRFVSTWWAVGIGLICLLVAGGGIVALAWASGATSLDDGGLVTFNAADEVYYVGEATWSDAEYLGATLTDEEYFGQAGATVRIAADSGVYTVSFVLRDGAWEDQVTRDAFQAFGGRIADDRFGRPLVIELCDEMLEPHVTLRVP
jgi:hypothetical protein